MVAIVLVVLIVADVLVLKKGIICPPPPGRSTLTRNRNSPSFRVIDEFAKIGSCQSFHLTLAIHTEVFPVKMCIHATMAVAAAAILVSAGSTHAQSQPELVPIHEINTSAELAFADMSSEPEYYLEAPEVAGGGYVELAGRPEHAHWARNPNCCDDVYVPCWTARAAAVRMTRLDPTHRILFQDPLDPDRYFDRGDFHFEFETGVDVSLARRVGTCYDLQARCLRVDGWNALATGSTASAAGLVVESDPPLFLAPGRSIAATYTSQLESIELNLRRHFNSRLTLLMGIRYADVDERFHAYLLGPGPVLGTYHTATGNRLFGLQFGCEAALWDRGGCLRIDNVLKAGVYANDFGAQDTVLDTGTMVLPASDRAGQIAFLGEAGLFGVYRLTDSLSIRGGYQVVLIEGVALATDQMAVTDFVAQDGIDTSGGLFYHGALLGIELVR